MNETPIRVRFAPAPTGRMHLGSIRTALINYLYAKKYNGTFVIRIEDTDPDRNFDPNAQQICDDLAWLGLTYQEGPYVGGPYSPYFQSQRSDYYQEKLDYLIEQENVYRCFCTVQELEEKRMRQRALGKPPRYDRTCLKKNSQEVEELLSKHTPFIWRFKIDHTQNIQITDLSRGTIDFALKNFSDFPLTRTNGSFTFIFANAIDDMLMQMSHVVRGEDHLSNTACQAALMSAYNHSWPVFLHLPILCNIDGKKLSKRDFGFSIDDLQKNGYLPEAICNYLGITGRSFEQEIMPMEKLIETFNPHDMHSSAQITYDVEKFNWINRTWIATMDEHALAQLCRPFLTEHYSTVHQYTDEQLAHILTPIKSEMTTLLDSVNLLRFIFEPIVLKKEFLDSYITPEHKDTIIALLTNASAAPVSRDQLQQLMARYVLPKRTIFTLIRIALMGVQHGPTIDELYQIIPVDMVKERFMNMVKYIENNY